MNSSSYSQSLKLLSHFGNNITHKLSFLYKVSGTLRLHDITPNPGRKEGTPGGSLCLGIMPRDCFSRQERGSHKRDRALRGETQLAVLKWTERIYHGGCTTVGVELWWSRMELMEYACFMGKLFQRQNFVHKFNDVVFSKNKKWFEIYWIKSVWEPISTQAS